MGCCVGFQCSFIQGTLSQVVQVAAQVNAAGAYAGAHSVQSDVQHDAPAIQLVHDLAQDVLAGGVAAGNAASHKVSQGSEAGHIHTDASHGLVGSSPVTSVESYMDSIAGGSADDAVSMEII